ncbi:serine hydrolase domain-containing protein [Bacilliculturomica massiliensis]|uniref:serine hydrolase domain-containing protein n=1 Tax=Bacilliculturomica massiliensis TaxID=1917867 RepID=UPI00103175BF|nr:serine hydrolase domain-containing protein [Bacilliculturomica massiliensis]
MRKLIEQNVDLIRREMAYWSVPGLALAVVRDGKEPETAAFGWRDQEAALKAETDTLFGVASCSKSMTAAMIAVLCGQGVLDLDVPVRRYAEELKFYDEEATRSATLRDMLCHRTGLGGHDGVWPDSISRRELAERLRYLRPSAPFRSRFQYSNLVYAMAGYVAERAAGSSWETLMRELIFEPLHMDRTRCTAEELRTDPNHAGPYQMIDGALRRLPVWNVDLAGPAASVSSTAEDMGRWLQFQLEGGRTPEGRQLISEELFAELHRGQIDYPDSSGMGEGFFPCDRYGLGWASGRYRERRFQKHTGKIDGYSSIQAYLPDEKIGVAVLMNLHSPAVPIFYTLVYTILDQALGLPDVGWAQRFHTAEPPAPDLYRDCELDLTGEIEKIVWEAEAAQRTGWEDYGGVYENPGYGRLTVRCSRKGREDGGDKDGGGKSRLFIDFRDMKDLPAVWLGEDRFRVDGVKEDIYTMKIPLTFFRADRAEREGRDKAVRGLRFRLEPMVEEIEFIKCGERK